MSDTPQKPKPDEPDFKTISQELKRGLAARRALDKSTEPRSGQPGKPHPVAIASGPGEVSPGESKMLVTASEEFRDSLQTIQGFLELLLEGKVPDARQARQFLGIAYRESQYLSNRVKDLQTAASAAAGKLRVKPAPVPMEAVFRSILNSLSDTATAKGLRLAAMPPEKLPSIQGDEALLRQALTGLLDLVIRRTEREGELVVNGSCDGTNLRLRLAGFNSGESHATGHGASAEAATDDVGAMGLPFYVAGQIIRQHEGTLV